MEEQAMITAPVAANKYNLDEEQEKKEILRHYRALLRALRPKIKKGDKELVRRAFEIAADAHKTMRRKSGEPYIFHPISVAMICVEEIGLGVRSTICASAAISKARLTSSLSPFFIFGRSALSRAR